MSIFSNRKNKNPFVAATIVYIIGTGIGQGTIFLSNSLFTRIMAQSDYGLYSNYYSYVSILSGVIGLNLFMGLTVGYVDYKDKYEEYRSSVLLLATLCSAIFSILGLGIMLMIGMRDKAVIGGFVLLHSFGFFINTYYVYSLNYLNLYKQKSVFLAMPYVCEVLFSALLIVLIKDVSTYYLRVIGSTTAILLFALFAYMQMMKSSKPRVKFEYWKYATSVSVPTILGSISSLIMQQCDKIMITSKCGAEENAIYSFVYVVGFIPQAVMQATNGAWDAWLFRNMNNSREKINRVLKVYMAFMALVIASLLAISPLVIRIMAPEPYWRYEYVMPFVASSGVMFICTLYNSVLTYHKKMLSTSIIVLIAAATNVGLNLVFIPTLGGIAAAYTSTISQIVMLLLYLVYSERNRMNIFSKRHGITFLLFLLVAIVVFAITYEYSLARYLSFGILDAIILVVMYKSWKQIKNDIK